MPIAPPLSRLRAALAAAQHPEQSLWRIYRPYFRGKGRQLLSISLASFVAGMSEALLLVVLANIALSIGSDASSAIGKSLGPLSFLHLTTGEAFALAALLGLLRFAFQLLAGHVAAQVTAQLTIEARAGTIRDYASASWAEQSRHEESDIQDLLLRHVNRTTSAMGVVAGAVATGCTLLALIISAVLVDPVAAALLTVMGGLLFMLIRPLTRLGKRVSQRQQKAGLDYGSRSLEAIGTSLEVRAFGVTEPVIERLSTATKIEARHTYTGLMLRQVVTSTYQILTIAILLGGMFAVYSLIDRPLASLGATVVILVRALNQGNTLQGAYHSLTETAPYLERLDRERAAFRAAVPHSGSADAGAISRLRFDRVTYHYEPERPALDEVTFEVRAGEAIGIIGPSGSGKSTLIQVLLRLRDPDSGHYLVNDTDAAEIADDEWFSDIAFVPQDSQVINDTVRANIAFFRDVSDEDVIAAAQRAHIHDEILAMPKGYDTPLGSRGGALSGGQRQRISIARSLVRRPSILVLDEPTSALDMRSEALVHETFTALKGSVTLFAIAHRLSTLNTCDRIMVMHEGRLQAFGSRAELESSSAFYRDALALSQIRS